MATSRLRPGDTVSVNSAGEAALDGPDRHAERVAQQAQAESAARRARMAATPGSAAPAAAAQAAERAAPNLASRAGSALRGAGSAAAAGARSAAAGAGKLVAPVVLGMTAADVADTSTSDYAKRFGLKDSSGLSGVGSALRLGAQVLGVQNPATLRKVGDAASFFDDTALRTAGAVTDLANTVGMGAFTPLMRDKAPPAAPAVQGAGTGSAPPPAAGSPDEVIGTFQGRPITRAQSDAIAGGQNFGGTAAPIATQAQASPLRRPDLGGSYATVGDRGGDINKQFDDLAKQIQDLHGGARFQARGSLATKLLRLGEMRADALGQNQGALVGQQSNQVRDIDSRRGAEASLYGTDVSDRSALRRDTATTAAARVKAAADALAARQQMSEAQLKLLDERATAMATDADGKVDLEKKQQIVDAAAVNFGGAIDGSAETIGQAAAEGADAAALGLTAQQMNEGVARGNESNALPALSRLREPTLGEAFDPRSNVTLGDNFRRLIDGLPFVDDSRVYDDGEGGDPRVLRARDTTRSQREALRRRGQLTADED